MPAILAPATEASQSKFISDIVKGEPLIKGLVDRRIYYIVGPDLNSLLWDRNYKPRVFEQTGSDGNVREIEDLRKARNVANQIMSAEFWANYQRE